MNGPAKSQDPLEFSMALWMLQAFYAFTAISRVLIAWCKKKVCVFVKQQILNTDALSPYVFVFPQVEDNFPLREAIGSLRNTEKILDQVHCSDPLNELLKPPIDR